MPNGGSGCCGTCWFNAKNKGEAGYSDSSDPVPDRCVIRQLDIPDPLCTCCANHPHRNSSRLEVPIGPVYTGDSDGNREFWIECPDTEEIRRCLLELLKRIDETLEPEYPIGIRL